MTEVCFKLSYYDFLPCYFQFVIHSTNHKLVDSIIDYVILFFNPRNSSSRNMALGLTPPVTETSTRNFPVAKPLPARKTDNLTTICERVVSQL
jgi:hypothetical protein